MRTSLPTLGLLVAFGAAACGGARPVLTPSAPAPAPQPIPQTPPTPTDPVSALIAESEQQFAAGRRALEAGHLAQARIAFDRSVEMLLESPYGARSDLRLRQHFDRLVDRINALEVVALRQGDGFTEKRADPAVIDALLADSTFSPPEASAETREAVAEDLARFGAFPISDNPRVLSYVEAFQGKLKPFLTDGLTRAGRYMPMIERVFREEGLPLELAYVPLIESAFKPTAKSRVSAQGVWQFMVPTARDFGLRYDWFIDERADPEKSTVAAAKYLKMLHRMFDGDWALALASYNGGQGRVQRAVKNSGKNDFWELTDGPGWLPRETREYVPMIMAAMVIAKNPEHYGFDIEPLPELAYDTVTLPGAVDLRKVAEWSGVSLVDIEELNPELRRWTTPAGSADYRLKVPVGKGVPLQARLASADPSELVAFRRYTVRRGDTLSGVANKHGIPRTELAVANGISARARLSIGQTLIIPRLPAAALASNSRPSSSSRGVQRASRGSNESRTIVYRVRRGDTLSGIAARHDVTVADLKRWNNRRSNMLKIGERLKILR